MRRRIDGGDGGEDQRIIKGMVLSKCRVSDSENSLELSETIEGNPMTV